MREFKITSLILILMMILFVFLIYSCTTIQSEPKEVIQEEEAISAPISEPANEVQEQEVITSEIVDNPTPSITIPKVKQFQISADEKAFNPSNVIVNKGDKVKITFNFNDKNIYLGGLDIRSNYFNVQYKKTDSIKSKTIEFIAEKSFVYIGYWPASNREKSSGKVEVIQ